MKFKPNSCLDIKYLGQNLFVDPFISRLEYFQKNKATIPIFCHLKKIKLLLSKEQNVT